MIVNPPFGIQISGGGSGGPNVPLLSQFSWLQQPAGSTASDQAGGLLVHQNELGLSSQDFTALISNTHLPGGPFTMDVGFTSDISSGSLGSTSIYGVYMWFGQSTAGGSPNRDAYSAEIFGLSGRAGSPSNTYQPAWHDWNKINNNSSGGGPGGAYYPTPLSPAPQYFRTIYDGTNFNFYFGSSLSSLTFWTSIGANSWLGKVPDVGGIGVVDTNALSQGNGVNGTYFYYNVT